MNVPFPTVHPSLLDGRWFNTDRPFDDDAELVAEEQAHQRMLRSVAQQYMKKLPLGKIGIEPLLDEIETEEEEGNEESEESEDSHDEDEEEEMRPNYSPVTGANDYQQEEEGFEEETEEQDADEQME